MSRPSSRRRFLRSGSDLFDRPSGECSQLVLQTIHLHFCIRDDLVLQVQIVF